MIIAIIAFMPLLAPPSVSLREPRKALILSSIEKVSPMGYAYAITRYLASVGYDVTFLNDTAVTLDVLTMRLDDYEIVIWRTDVYERSHTTYWYVGESAGDNRSAAYATDYQAGWVDRTYGILGVSLAFFRNHFQSGSLEKVKLAVLVSSTSSSIAKMLIQAGVRAAVDFYGSISLPFNIIDYVTRLVVEYLANGATVKDAVSNTVGHFLTMRNENPLDSGYVPPVWYMGDGTVTVV